MVEVGLTPTNDVGIQQPPPSLPPTLLIFPAKNPLPSSNTLTSRTRAAGTIKEMDVIHKLVQRLNVVGNTATISEGSDGSNREGEETATEMSVIPSNPSTPLTKPQNKSSTHHLPKTNEYLATHPRNLLPPLSKATCAKAVHAKSLLTQISTRLSDTQTELSALPPLPTLQSHLADATARATAIHSQLMDLEKMVAEEVRRAREEEVARLEARVDAEFETYARERRAEADRRKEGLETRLREFGIERLEVVLEGQGEAWAGRKREKRGGVGLEEVSLGEGESGGELEDFFGDGGGEGSSKGEGGREGKGSTSTRAKGRAKTNVKKNVVLIQDEDIADEGDLDKFYP